MSCTYKKYIIIQVFFILLYQTSISQVLDYSTKIKINGNRKTTERYYTIRINDKSDNWLSKVSVNHSLFQKFTLLKASIINNKGDVVRRIKKKDISSRNSRSNGTFHEDELVKEFDLHWNEYPYTIEYSYKLVEKKFIYVVNWYPAVYTTVATLNSSLDIEIPINYDVNINSDVFFDFKETVDSDFRKLKWKSTFFKVAKEEIFSLNKEEYIPSVKVIPLEFKYGVKGNTGSWKSFGNWQSKLNNETDLLPLSEQVIVDDLTKGITDKEEIIKILYYYLQDNTKYINVSIDFGGLKSYPASYVCKNKYGDCKALTTYMKAMLKHVGIESFYTKIKAGGNVADINIKFPSQQFNHIILNIPIVKDTIWLENTSKYNPYNYLGTFTQDRLSLSVKENNSKLIRTPKMKLEDVRVEHNYNFKLNETGEGNVSSTNLLKGESFENYRYYKNATSKEIQEEKIISDHEINGLKLTSWNILDINRDNNYLEINFKGTCDSQFRNISNLKIIKPIGIDIPDLEEPKERIHPVRISFPINISNYIVYDLSFLNRYDVQLPKNIEIDSKYGSYKANYKLEEDKIIVKESFVLYSGEYSLDQYKGLYSFISDIKLKKKNSTIILNNKK
ncbi:MAG: DUF3857 domain-containing protein [Flavobacteriaceae bacterium]|nr:DUF3857 domain-containing protein [Flavobacteriaceae bacterium]